LTSADKRRPDILRQKSKKSAKSQQKQQKVLEKAGKKPFSRVGFFK
jgi:hypothetical protein